MYRCICVYVYVHIIRMAGKINTRKTFSGCPYSVLVYGLLAGLQALHSARLTGKRGGTGLAPGFRVWFRTLGAGGFQVGVGMSIHLRPYCDGAFRAGGLHKLLINPKP